MPKIRIKTVPAMQSGGYNPMTAQQRDAWNRQQVAARQQGFIGNEHSREPGNQFMQSQGMDPNQLAAYQADLLEQRNTSPWGKRPGAYMTPGTERDFSPADSHYGKDTAREMYLQYNVQGKPFGTDWKAATAYSGQLEGARQKEWENFGKPEANINYQAPVTTPTVPTTPKPTGLAATGFPTREEAIAKYKTRKASGQELPSNYFLKGNPDYSIDTLRRTGKGSDEYAYGGNVTKRVRITGVPTMAEGGYANKSASHGYGNQQVGQSYALNRFWSSPAGYPGSTSQVNPYGKVGNTLPEAKDGGDINAEKQEMVLGDFDQDGQQELMNVDGPPHTEGGKDVNVPSNSFVFSDTKDLKIKDPQILAMFGMAPKRGGYTPAFIAKKYDLNKLKKILDDPNADELSKKTAQLMNDNYLSKLNKLAQVQEGMKGAMGMEHHDPERGQVPAQEPPVEIAGNMGPGGAEMMQPEVMAMYGGVPQYQRGGKNNLNSKLIAKGLSAVEGNYDSLPWIYKNGKKYLASSAVGKYQFLWDTHNPQIAKVTGIKDKESFRKNPQAQEKYFEWYLENNIPESLQRIRGYNKKRYTDDELVALIHFKGETGAKKWLQSEIDETAKNNLSIPEYINRYREGKGNYDNSAVSPLKEIVTRARVTKPIMLPTQNMPMQVDGVNVPPMSQFEIAKEEITPSINDWIMSEYKSQIQKPTMQNAGLYPTKLQSLGTVPNWQQAIPISPWSPAMANQQTAQNTVANQQVAQSVPSVYNMYPSNLTAQGYVHERPTPENVRSFIQQSIQPRPGGYKPGNLTNDQYDKMRRRGWDGKSNPGEWAQVNQYDQVQAALKESGLTNPATDATSENQLGNSIREGRWKAFKPQGPDYNPTIKDVTAVQDPYSDYPVPWAGNRVTPPTTTPTKKEEEEEEEVTNRKQRRGIFMNPNMYGDAMNLAQMLQLQKFVPYSPVPQAVIPPTVFTDPTRAIAAQQEAARNAMEMNNQSANSRAARANNLASQGIAGTQAADIIGQYGNQNVAIANAANAQAAQITNQLMQMEANRLEELNKGNFLAARDYQREMGRLQAEWADRKQKQHNTAVKRAWANKVSEYFNIGMDDMPEFKPGMDTKFFQDLKSPDATASAIFKQNVKDARDNGANWTDAVKYATAISGGGKGAKNMSNLAMMDLLSGDNPSSMMYGGSHMAMPEMAPYYAMGGNSKKAKLKKFIR